MRQVLHISAGTRGVQAVDQVGGIDVRQGLGGDDFDPAGPLEMFHQISLSSFTTEDVGNLGSSPPCNINIEIKSEVESGLNDFLPHINKY